MRLITVVGARPGFVKVAPLLPQLSRAGIDVAIAYTGTRRTARKATRQPKRMTFFGVDVPTPEWFLDLGDPRAGSATGRATSVFEELFASERPDAALLVGDTNTTVAAAIAAAKCGIGVVHLEAGLRCDDLGVPEEVNRVRISQLATTHLTSTEAALANLEREGVDTDRIYFVGSPLAEAVLQHAEAIGDAHPCVDYGCEPGHYLLASFCTRRILESSQRLRGVLRGLASTHMRVILPDPGEFRRAVECHGATLGENVKLIDAVAYTDMLALQRDAAAIVTDSSGVQEEACVLRTPCVTVRKATERCVTLECGGNRLSSATSTAVHEAVQAAMAKRRRWSVPKRWDRAVSMRVARAILRGVEPVN